MLFSFLSLSSFHLNRFFHPFSQETKAAPNLFSFSLPQVRAGNISQTSIPRKKEGSNPKHKANKRKWSFVGNQLPNNNNNILHCLPACLIIYYPPTPNLIIFGESTSLSPFTKYTSSYIHIHIYTHTHTHEHTTCAPKGHHQHGQ